MSSQVLPKKRGLAANRVPSGADRRQISNRAILMRNNTINNNNITNTPGSNRVLSGHRVLSGARHASRSLAIDGGDDSFSEENAIHFNENKHTILSNFEEWIKLSTDNKITLKNSWQFALIDYFHDLNVIKDGDNINFQRASATLDGCVKIYLSRVESAAAETGKLLSGLAKKKNDLEDVDEQDVDENGEPKTGEKEQADESGDDDNEELGKKKRKINRIVESTLVDFETLRIKKLDQELAIDPLFKKALAEFDEGGAKSLLLNTLNIDGSGRVVFDATTKPVKEGEQDGDDSTQDKLPEPEPEQDKDVDISKLGKIIFRNDESLDDMSICPSLSEFNTALEDVTKAKSILTDFNNKITTAAETEILTPGNDLVGEGNDGGFDYGDFGGNDDGFDGGNFGSDYNDLEENDNENDNNNNDDSNDPINNLNQSIMQRLFNDSEYVQLSKSTQVLDRDLMAYFDERMKTNWRGPEHWKVAALKKSKKIEGGEVVEGARSTPGLVEPKKKQDQVIVNFFDEDDNEDTIFEGPRSASLIVKKNDVNTSNNKLPDDIRYNSARLTNLFTKPQVSIVYFPKRKKSDTKDEPQFTDENFFAERYHKQEEQQEADALAASFHQAEYEDFNNDFGGDDYAIDFNDALEGDVGELNEEDKDIASTQVIGKKRPDHLNFSRVAKRVDVKFLKDNLWKTIKEEAKTIERPAEPNEENIEEQVEPPKQTFGKLVASVANLYGTEQRKELSTSFYFICLLHLANEHGLTISTNETHDDMEIIGF